MAQCRCGTGLALGAIATLAGAGLLARRGSRSQGDSESFDKTLEDAGIYVSDGAPVALLRDLVALEPSLRRSLTDGGWSIESCTMSTELLGPMLAARGWTGSQVIDGTFIPSWSQDMANGTGHDWIVVDHDGGEFVVDAAVNQFDDQWGWPESGNDWYDEYRSGFTFRRALGHER